MSTFEQMKRVIVDCSGVDAWRVKAEASMVDDLGLDSLDLVEIVMAAEEIFGVEIEDQVLEAIDTVQDAVSAVDHALASRGAAA